MGVNEQIIFPEIDYDKIDTLRGLDITITTTARNDDEGRALLKALRFPFRVISTTIDEKTDPNHEAPVEEAPAEEEIVAEAGTAELESEEAPAVREVSEESSAEAAEAEKVPAAEETAEETLIQAEERESVDLQPEEASADENQEES